MYDTYIVPYQLKKLSNVFIKHDYSCNHIHYQTPLYHNLFYDNGIIIITGVYIGKYRAVFYAVGGYGTRGLYKANVPLMSNAVCSYLLERTIPETEICAGAKHGGVDSCQVIINIDDVWIWIEIFGRNTNHYLTFSSPMNSCRETLVVQWSARMAVHGKSWESFLGDIHVRKRISQEYIHVYSRT